MTSHHQYHQPVLADETLRVLAPKTGETYLDLTAGYGGHADSVLERIGRTGFATLIDRDGKAQQVLRERYGSDKRVVLMQSDFAKAAQKLAEEEKRFSMILLDVGLSSPQLDQAERGFSFRLEGPLDMRMDQEQMISAERIVNTYREADLTTLIQRYGEEPRARRIARAIVGARPIASTTELAAVIESVLPRRQGKIHPATRTFQALRIAVNDELTQLEQTLPLAVELLEPKGRLAVISFHSLEDRIVKRFFKERSSTGYDVELSLITKKPIGGDTHDVFNPRARSARLRAAVKINTNTERG
jgi:16S rRNA (cytosine1402-N4)-methyltransferase